MTGRRRPQPRTAAEHRKEAEWLVAMAFNDPFGNRDGYFRAAEAHARAARILQGLEDHL